jgi:hypothetical protein
LFLAGHFETEYPALGAGGLIISVGVLSGHDKSFDLLLDMPRQFHFIGWK